VENRWQRLHERLHRHPVTGLLTKVVVTIVGTAVVLVGVVLSGPGVPGPGFVVIIFGLAILATEWSWAERLLKRARLALRNAAERARAMDPAVRRRRILLTTGAIVLVAGGIVGYLVAYDWPTWAVSAWNWVQDLSGVVPELPGM